MNLDEGHNNKVSLKSIACIVSDYFGYTPIELFRKTRKQEFVEARRYYNKLSKEYTRKSLYDIGAISVKYGEDKPYTHAGVLNSINNLTNELETYKEPRKHMSNLRRLVESKMLNSSIIKELIPSCVDLLDICVENSRLIDNKLVY